MIKLTFSLLMASLFLIGCKKSGCNDIYASNYDSSVEVGDASCTYEVQFMFVMNNHNYRDMGIDTIYVYVNNGLLGKQSTDDLTTSTPACDNPDIMVFKKEMNNVVSEILHYRIETADSLVIREETTNLIRGRCQTIALY